MPQEPSPERLNPELAALEASLASLMPRPSIVDRDRLMFLAGQANAAAARHGSPASWLWPLATAASLLLAVGLGTFACLRGPRVDQPATCGPTVTAEGLVLVPAESVQGMADYLRLRKRVIDRGVESVVDQSTGGAGGPAADGPRIDRRALLKELLRS